MVPLTTVFWALRAKGCSFELSFFSWEIADDVVDDYVVAKGTARAFNYVFFIIIEIINLDRLYELVNLTLDLSIFAVDGRWRR